MRQPVEQRGRHLRVAEHAGPLGTGKVGGDNDRGSLVEPADQGEEELAAGLSERPIAKLVEHDKVEPGEVPGGAIGETPLSAASGFTLQAVDEVDG
jgi:hypothetical protein